MSKAQLLKWYGWRVGMMLAMVLLIVAACDGGGRHTPWP